MVQVFKVLDTGETEEIKEEKDIKDILDTNEVYIIVSEHRDKTIWLWKGTKSSVRRKFIGERYPPTRVIHILNLPRPESVDFFCPIIFFPPRRNV